MTILLTAIVWWKWTLLQGMGFLILAGVLVWKVIPFLRDILRKRTREFEDTFSGLERDAKETEDRLADLRRSLAQKEAEEKRRIEEALAEGTRAKENALAEANAQAEAILDRAVREIGIEREKAVLGLRNEVCQLTLRASELLLEKIVTPEVHARLVKEYLHQLDAVPS